MPPKTAAVIADRCRLRYVPPLSVDPLGAGEADLDRSSGFITLRFAGPTDSLKLSWCAKGLGHWPMLTRRILPLKSPTLLCLDIGGIGGTASTFPLDSGGVVLPVSWLQFLVIAFLRLFSPPTAFSSSLRWRRRRKTHSNSPMSTSPAIIPERPPMIACLCAWLIDESFESAEAALVVSAGPFLIEV